LQGQSEADYLYKYFGDYIVQEHPDESAGKNREYYFICEMKACPREHRPFFCRVFPFLPIVSLDGKVVGVYQHLRVNRDHNVAGYEGEAGKIDGCYLEWGDILTQNPEWEARFIGLWEYCLKNEEIRRFLSLFYVDIFADSAYGISQEPASTPCAV